ncbi:Bdr family repetitive protein [Borreliella kurtenbachii]|uniref:Bdr family repetitive protein n=1 Tax=Borreliella kurtenbachii TaxID=1196056 RepID=UPI003AB76BA4
MRNLAHNAIKIENIRLEFLNKGFSEETIDFVLLQNDNYNFEVLKEKMNSLEQQIINAEKNFQKDIDGVYIKIDSVNTKIDNVEKSLNTKIDSVKNELNAKIDSVKNELNAKIDSLDTKIDNVEKALQKDISSLDNKIDVLKNELNASNRTIQVILIMGITLAPIIYSIFNKYFFN